MADTFHSGDVSPENCVYRAIHLSHNFVHEVTVLREQEFPECIHCGDAVRFQKVKQLPDNATLYPGFNGVLVDKAA
jgi:hypothetical protein